MTATPDKTQIERKVTIYRRAEFFGNIVKLQASRVAFWRGPYAQYASALFVEYRLPRQRLTRSFVETTSLSVLILDGWGHPDPASFLGKGTPSEGNPDIIVRVSRYLSCDRRWTEDFNGLMNPYLAEHKPKVIADFRESSGRTEPDDSATPRDDSGRR